MTDKMRHSVDQMSSAKHFKQPYDNSSSTQRKRILSYLEKNHRLSTIAAREQLGILHPGGRIMELRKKGYRIDTHWIEEPDSNGVAHRVGLYVYQGRSGGQYEA